MGVVSGCASSAQTQHTTSIATKSAPYTRLITTSALALQSQHRIPKGAFVRWAIQPLSVTVQRGDAEMGRRSALVISREQGLRYDAGFAVPVLMS